MNEKIRHHVNQLFKNAPNTKRVNDLKEEIISNASEKYTDLINEGKISNDAYEIVVAGIGDVGELIEELNRNSYTNNEYSLKQNKKTALIVSICVGIYILSLISITVLSELNIPDFIVVVAFFALIGVATCILIYHFMSRPRYNKYDDTMVEEFKEWKKQKDQNNQVKSAIHSTLWTLTVLIYLFISFRFNMWKVSWLVFVIAVLFSNIIELVFSFKKSKIL